MRPDDRAGVGAPRQNVGAADPERLADGRLPVHVNGPVTHGEYRHPWTRHWRERLDLMPQLDGSPRLGRPGDLALPKMHTLDGLLS